MIYTSCKIICVRFSNFSLTNLIWCIKNECGKKIKSNLQKLNSNTYFSLLQLLSSKIT